ncbi:MAG: methylated-DNA--[protein]-cysteine S-methyltransferase [Phycisphaerae bacterium]|nr:methylated-DNA--[protein]-cysteine S-methyltransferase [Phycisphaerae bacterium]
MYEELAGRIIAYFGGAPMDFNDVPTPGGPPFFRRCWEACRRIPPGETRTYAELAAMAGGGNAAARAAGQAMRNNRLPVIIPCHRVRGAGGRLGGFAGEDDPGSVAVDRKRWLLDHEITQTGAGAAALI